MGEKKKPLKNLYAALCSYENLAAAFQKAKKRKSLKPYVIKFGEELEQNLRQLRYELVWQTYAPLPLTTFILRDPKTRKISKSDFRDRVVHHAICNVIEPMLDKSFISDSFANRVGKGTFNAIERFELFARKVSSNNTREYFVLKADIKHYFDTVNHEILLSILKKKIKDEKVLWLIRTILANHNTIEEGRGMPLGNLTSQFFANVFLNELDQFVKHTLKAKYYIRYVDDFAILHTSKQTLMKFKKKINIFLKEELDLELHPDKSKILVVRKGVGFLGFRIFPHHKLVNRRNMRKFERRLKEMRTLYQQEKMGREQVVERFEGWLAYVKNADTYKYRRHLVRLFNSWFPLEPSLEVTNVKKHGNFVKKIESEFVEFSPQKTLQLFRKGLSIEKIAEKRGIKESTVWEHLAKLVEFNQFPLWRILSREKVSRILPHIHSENDLLKEIKARINDGAISYDEIKCVLASIRGNNKKKNIIYLVKDYRRRHCQRKCCFFKEQQKVCRMKFDQLVSENPSLEMTRKEFEALFNDHIDICILPEVEKRKYLPWKPFMVMKKKAKMQVVAK